MEIQYSEGLPDVVIDREKQRMYIDTTDETYAGISAFMEKIAMDDVDAFAISPEFSAGFFAMEEALKAAGEARPFVKVQTTGPISFGLTIVDENKRAIYYNDMYKDAVVKGLTMKCRWQIRRYKGFADNVICFIDEPILSAFGSSTYVSVSRDDVVAVLKEVIDAIHEEGGIAGIHCCGNTEWSILMDAGVDIVNFDAFDFGDTIALYPDAVKKHLEAGKVLAWGVVPTNTDKIADQTVETLIAKFDEGVDNLAKAAGIDRELIVNQAMVTPSCGTGSLPVPVAEKVFDLLGKLSAALKAR
jgi:methionine synthase II (cobalamin-independent)